MTSEKPSRRLPAGRKAGLVDFITAAGEVTVAQLAEAFDVSIDTVRRDLDQLDADGAVVRTHGGAVSAESVLRSDQRLGVRLKMRAREKDLIGSLAADLIADGAVVIINSGTTALALARHIRRQRDLTIATNNLLLPGEISPKVLRDLYVFGGSVRTVTQATTGPVSFQVTPGGGEVDVLCDIAFIAVGAVSASGYSTSNLLDAAMMTSMMQRARKVVVLADSSKFEHRLFAQVGELRRADVLVSDRLPAPPLRRALETAGVQVISPARDQTASSGS